MRDDPFDFHGTAMVVRATTDETGTYAVIAMHHPPHVGPALHVHPRGAETFYIVAGSYEFYRGDEVVQAQPGDGIVIPAGVPHRYRSGAGGGQAVVVTPPGLEHYFWRTAERLRAGALSLDEEFTLAAAFGQEFLDRAGHWGAPDGSGAHEA